VEFLGRRFPDLMREARAALAAFVGADPDDLVYMPNATTALNTVARSLPLRPGDEVVGTDHEYGAVDRLWRFVCARRGARYVRARVPVPVEAPEQVVEAVWAHVTERTRVLACSHLTSPTALIFPLAALLHRARTAGILTVVDGAHAPGQLPVDLRALDPDFYAGNCHKWLCAPKGAGFLYARRDRHELLEPLVVSWGWDRHEDRSRPPASVPSSPGDAGDDTALARRARAEITALTGLPPLSPDDAGWYAQMVSVALPVADPEAAQHRLRAEGIEVPVFRWTDRCLLRVSVQAYNEPADIEHLVAAVRRLLG